MIPLIIASISAVSFLGLSVLVYGPGVVADSAWVVWVFLGLIGAGATVSLLGQPTPRWYCQLKDWVNETFEQNCAPCPG